MDRYRALLSPKSKVLHAIVDESKSLSEPISINVPQVPLFHKRSPSSDRRHERNWSNNLNVLDIDDYEDFHDHEARVNENANLKMAHSVKNKPGFSIHQQHSSAPPSVIQQKKLVRKPDEQIAESISMSARLLYKCDMVRCKD